MKEYNAETIVEELLKHIEKQAEEIKDYQETLRRVAFKEENIFNFKSLNQMRKMFGYSEIKDITDMDTTGTLLEKVEEYRKRINDLKESIKQTNNKIYTTHTEISKRESIVDYINQRIPFKEIYNQEGNIEEEILYCNNKPYQYTLIVKYKK